jgi:hypothetical protein
MEEITVGTPVPQKSRLREREGASKRRGDLHSMDYDVSYSVGV